jgi:glycosyltransferase involved in cell wall biosynthesis
MSGGTRSYEIAKRLVASGHQVNMITSFRQECKKNNWFHTIEDGIHVHWLPIFYSNKLTYPQRIKAFFKFAFVSIYKTLTIDADVVFASSTPLTVALPAVFTAKIKKIPMVFEVRDLWPELPIAVGALKNPLLILAAKLLENYAYSNSRAIVALSPGIKEGICRQGYASDRVHVIPNSCDLNFFQVPIDLGISFRKRLPWLGELPLVIYAGTFGKINGVEYLVRLAAETQKIAPNVRFLAVGNGVEFEKVKNLAQNLSVLNKNFFLMSRMPKKEMPALFSAATISTSTFIDLPQMWNNSANKFFDSLAAGRPVAINYEGWQAEILRESGAGLILSATDITAAAKSLSDAINNKNWVTNASASALSLARSCFDRDELTKQFEKILLHLSSNNLGDNEV